MLASLFASLEAACLAARQQHAHDIAVYQSSHQEWKNRWLHHILIPIECFAAFLFVTGLVWKVLPLSRLQLTLLSVLVVGFPMGLLSLAMSPSDHPWAGLSCFGFMVASPWVSCILVVKQPSVSLLVVALVTWIAASSLQVAVGHWLWEENSPDVLSSHKVSWLSLSHSVQIAWSS